jgi:thiamine biosynthesis protein ThiS
MSESKYFFLNGQKYFTPSKLTLSELVNYFNYNTSLLVVEHNRFISNKENWDKVYITHNDTIEIVTIVGGG